MQSKIFGGRAALAAGLVIACAFAFAWTSADAARRGSHAPRGSFTHNAQRTRTADGHTRHDEWKRANGRTATRDATVVNDRAAGTRTRDVVATGPNGKTATREDVTTRTDSGHTRASTVTLPNGKTATRDATVTRDEDAGARTKEVIATGPNGNTRALSDQIQRTDGGFTRSTEVTHANGSSVTRDVTLDRDPETHTVSKDVTIVRDTP
jgi:hypothetical protein